MPGLFYNCVKLLVPSPAQVYLEFTGKWQRDGPLPWSLVDNLHSARDIDEPTSLNELFNDLSTGGAVHGHGLMGRPVALRVTLPNTDCCNRVNIHQTLQVFVRT